LNYDACWVSLFMELRHLRYFVVVAEELNVRRAAQRLHLSQPPLSRQIHDLEAELGTKLFSRHNRRLALTPAGECLSKEARQILAQVERAAQRAVTASRGEAGQLTIGFLPPIGGLFLPQAIREFRERFPKADLTIMDLAPQEQITALIEHRIDLGFVPLQVVERNPELEFEPVREVDLVVGLPPGHRLAKQQRLTLPKLAGESFVLLYRPSSAGGYDWIVELCRKAGFEPRVAKLADSPQGVLELVAAGFGITLVPALFQRLPSEVVFRPLPSATPKFQLSFARRRDNYSPLLKTLLGIFRSHFRKATLPTEGRSKKAEGRSKRQPMEGRRKKEEVKRGRRSVAYLSNDFLELCGIDR
jgi:DNA-binding transcriptional LysR family regulator